MNRVAPHVLKQNDFKNVLSEIKKGLERDPVCAGYYSCVNVKRFTMTYTHTHVLKCTCVTSQRTQTVILVSLEELRIRGGRKTYFLVDTFSLVSIKILWYVYFILVKTDIYSKRWMHYNAALFTIVHAVLFTTAKI